MARHLLVDYFKLQEMREAQRLLHDSMLDIYSSLCAVSSGCDDHGDICPNILQTVKTTSTPRMMRTTAPPQPGNRVSLPFPRSKIALQRERTSKMKLADIEPVMHLPIQEASKKMLVCTTVLKKICRRNGICRWPHRKVKAIDRSLGSLKKSLFAKKLTKSDDAMVAKIKKLTRKRAECYQGNPDQAIGSRSRSRNNKNSKIKGNKSN